MIMYAIVDIRGHSGNSNLDEKEHKCLISCIETIPLVIPIGK